MAKVTKYNMNWVCTEWASWQIGTAKDGYDSGVITTPHGYVSVYAQGDNTNFHVSTLDFIHKGRTYRRTWRGKRYSRRYLVTLAKRFVNDVVEGKA